MSFIASKTEEWRDFPMNRLHLLFRLLVNRHRKSTIRFLFSFLMSLLLLFLFSLASFFRPYYFHQNEFMDEKVVTLAKEFDESPTGAALEKSDAFFEESISGLGIERGIVETKYSYCFTIDDVDLFFVSEDFSLLSLGLVPFDVVTAPKAKTAYAIGTESASLSGLADLLGVDILWRKNPTEDNGQIVFPSDCALILNIADMDLAKVKADSFLTYCTLSLEGTLTDQEIYRLYMMSKAENLFPLAFDDFIYPARNYALFYPVIHSISALGIVLSLIVLCCAVLSQAIVDYLREKDDLGETALLRLFGLDRLGYVLMKTSSSLLPILSGSILVLILYTLFMVVFKAAKGFTFFFAPLLYLAYFLPSVLLGLLSALYSFLLYRKTDGRAYSILEGNEKKE